MTTLEHCRAETRAWVRRAVIALGLCPFAKAPDARDRVRYAAVGATSIAALTDAFDAELLHLASVDETRVETTLLIHPFVLTDFRAFNDFVDTAEARIDAAGLAGTVQLATFHPDYRFAGTAGDDLGNATNRSPYPTLQLLRESSVERAAHAFPDPAVIYEANIATLQRLGVDGWAALRAACRRDAETDAAVDAAADAAADAAVDAAAPARRRSTVR